MRLLHTSDWHLGHTLHGVERSDEHARFVAWLEGVIAAERVDALLITGDLFDTATPPASAERALLDLLARLRGHHPDLGIVIIGGNHDSPARLESWAGVLRALSIHVVATLRGAEGFDPGRAIVRLPGAVVAAVPFLRPADLPPRGEGPAEARSEPAGGALPGHVAGRAHHGVSESRCDATARAFAAVVAAARARRSPGEALLVLGHLEVRGALLSPDSERRVAGDAPDAGLFPPDAAYVALGHLHRAQPVGTNARYAGSPLPLSMAESGYEHQVVLVDLEGERATQVRSLRVPRTVDLLRIPGSDVAALTPDEALARLEALPAAGPLAPGEPDRRPLLEVRVATSGAEPGLRRRIEAALEGKAARLVRLIAEGPPASTEAALADAAPHARLDEVAPRDVLLALWAREREEPPPADVLSAFDALLLEVGAGPREPSAAANAARERASESAAQLDTSGSHERVSDANASRERVQDASGWHERTSDASGWHERADARAAHERAADASGWDERAADASEWQGRAADASAAHERAADANAAHERVSRETGAQTSDGAKVAGRPRKGETRGAAAARDGVASREPTRRRRTRRLAKPAQPRDDDGDAGQAG